MSTQKDYLYFILEQLSLLDQITYRSMMGEYIIYYRGKIAAYLCDDRLLVKILPITLKLLPNAHKEKPYVGAKDMLLVEEIDNKEFLKLLFESMYGELPLSKKRNTK